MPDDKAIRIALHEYASAVHILAYGYADDMTQIQLRHANELRIRQDSFNSAMRDQRDKLTKRLGLASDA